MAEMPTLETARLLIRPFVMEDLTDVHRLFDVELLGADLGTDNVETLAERARWLEWTVLNYAQLAKLHQPPYGDRAVILKSTGQLIGSCGFVPCLNAFEQLPYFGGGDSSEALGRYSAEFGLFYAISPAHRRYGYASEAAQALVEYAFQHLRLKRVVATTNSDNVAAIGVMGKLGMWVERNPRPEPPWLQVVGVLKNNT
jgi:RimJ/RimL family protein N-acetyltransferase